jgi:hypothetical protein
MKRMSNLPKLVRRRSSYLTENTVSITNTNQLMLLVGNNLFIFWESYEIHEYTLWVKKKLMEVSGQLHTLAAVPRGKEPLYPLDMRLAGPQSRPGHYGEEKILTLSGIEPRPSSP